MPYVRKTGATPNTAEASAPPEAPSKFENLRSWLGTGVRLGSGFLANAGGLPGALAGGGGELLAQGIEGSISGSTPARVAVEAGIGAIPLGKTLSAGRALRSAGKGAGFNAAGDVMRQGAEGNFSADGEGWDAKRSMYAAGGGAALGGLFGKFAPGMGDLPLDDATRLQKANEARKAAGQAARIPGRPASSAANVHPPLPRGNDKELEKLEGLFKAGRTNKRARVNEEQSTIDAFEKADVSADARHMRKLEARDKDVADSWDKAHQEERLRELKKTLKLDTPKTSITERLSGSSAKGNPESATLRYSEVVDEVEDVPTAKLAGMQDDGAGGQFPLYTIQGGAAHGSTVSAKGLAKYGIAVPEETGIRPAPSQGVAGAFPGDGELGLPKDPVVTDHLARLLNAEVKNPGQAPRAASPEASPDFYRGPFNPRTGVTDDIPFDSPGGTGRNWVDEQLEYIDELNADQAPSKFGGRAPRSYKPKPSVMKPASSDEEGLTDLMNYLGVDAAYAKGDVGFRKSIGDVYGRTKAQAMASNSDAGIPPTSPKAGAGKTPKGKGPGAKFLGSESGKGGMFGSGSETGAINPELLSTIAGGSIGGLVDAAWGDDSNPLEGILAGAAVGGGVGMIPKILSSTGKGPELLQTPEGRKQVAEEFVNMIPQFQRFAYLSDARGLPMNAIVGPYGAVLTGAIEAILSGDQRGWALLKEVRNPLNFIKEMHSKASLGESMKLLAEGELGRAEGMPFKLPKGKPQSFEEGMSVAKLSTSAPGVWMTMGDLQARRMLQRADYSQDEARRMTLTAEPRTATGKDITNLGRSGSPLWNIALPFKRTPANIMEEGTSRTPGLGSLADYLSGKQVSGREQIVQQAGGLGAGVAGYQVGQELDDPRSNMQNMARRGFTNSMGRYGLPAHLGVILGQTVGQDQKLSKQKIEQMFDSAIPLPGVDTFVDTAYQAVSENPTLPRGFKPFRPFTDTEDSQPLSRYAQLRRR